MRSRGEKDHSGKNSVPSETYQAEPGNGHLMVHKKNIVVNNSQAFSMNISMKAIMIHRYKDNTSFQSNYTSQFLS